MRPEPVQNIILDEPVGQTAAVDITPLGDDRPEPFYCTQYYEKHDTAADWGDRPVYDERDAYQDPEAVAEQVAGQTHIPIEDIRFKQLPSLNQPTAKAPL